MKYHLTSPLFNVTSNTFRFIGTGIIIEIVEDIFYTDLTLLDNKTLRFRILVMYYTEHWTASKNLFNEFKNNSLESAVRLLKKHETCIFIFCLDKSFFFSFFLWSKLHDLPECLIAVKQIFKLKCGQSHIKFLYLCMEKKERKRKIKSHLWRNLILKDHYYIINYCNIINKVTFLMFYGKQFQNFPTLDLIVKVPV